MHKMAATFAHNGTITNDLIECLAMFHNNKANFLRQCITKHGEKFSRTPN